MKKTNTKSGPRLPRSYGSFILLTTLLLVLFVIFGKSPWTGEEEISQDEFRYLLYAARLEKPRLQGDRFVVAEEKGPNGGPPARRVRASFADAKTVEAELKRAAKALEKVYREEDFLEGLERKEIELLHAYPIKAYEGNEKVVERFFADVLDGGQQRYVEVGPGARGLDLVPLFEAARKRGAPIEGELVFNLPAGVTYHDANPVLVLVLVQFAPWIVIILLLYFFVVRQLRSPGGGGGVLSFGRSRATLYTKENRTNVTFEDVAGIDEAKEEVQEIIEFLKNPARFQRLGGRIPRGVLLVGPPGAGKTLLAKAIAGEAEVPFFSISGSDFVEMFVGVGASRVRDLFKQAKENSPCIIFLDEIDAVGRKRGTGLGGGHDEREQTLNAILVEMDGFGTDEGVIVIAATNRPDVLDPALLRPGRFDREVVIDLPDVKGREAILRVHARKVKMGTDVEFGIVARSTPAFSGADLAAVINEAAILAAMKRKEQVGMEDLEEARERVRFGRAKKSRVMEREDRLVIAYHEAGHALVAALLPDAERPHKVTIIPRGMALGLTMKLPEKDRRTTTRKRMRAEISVAYGGRIAEALACEDISSGAHDDIRRATELARLMVCEWGMSEQVGPVHYGERMGSDFLGQEFSLGRNHSEAQAEQIDREVRAILDSCYGRAEALLQNHRAELGRVAEGLLLHETLTGVEVTALIEGTTPEALRPEAARAESPAPATKVAAPAPVPARGVLPGEEPGLAPA
ncbi:MAG TPA: ATP-dependent zinc metalloprotease FtsH [Planctomycetota bacterium]|nr:ATP-dependent zinc metalloprotease FtsH [Planctomycetota bacterium]